MWKLRPTLIQASAWCSENWTLVLSPEPALFYIMLCYPHCVPRAHSVLHHAVLPPARAQGCLGPAESTVVSPGVKPPRAAQQRGGFWRCVDMQPSPTGGLQTHSPRQPGGSWMRSPRQPGETALGPEAHSSQAQALAGTQGSAGTSPRPGLASPRSRP